MFNQFAALGINSKSVMGELQVVCDILEVFPDNINDLPPKQEVNLSIDYSSRKGDEALGVIG